MRRQTKVPSPFRAEDHARAARLPTIQLGPDLRIEYSLSAPEPVGLYDVPLDELMSVIRRQVCDAWIFLGSDIVGGVQLMRYSIPAFMDAEEVLYVMDMDEQEESDLACALEAEFGDIGEEVGAYGDIVEIRRVWMKPISSLAGRSSDAVNSLVGAFCPDFALIVLKAFPLEYEHAFNSPDESFADLAFNRRRAAMMRLYTKTYSVQPMQGSHGEQGWMYRRRAE
ncbi:hypothetical protein D1224_00470 [Henriciella barbarensis]|uniref:Uncharacterized protein n=1 Tax=Henriciella barbarensis TaxID=86342 RepID=A0A399R4C4_9PROT|nr:hypothetical protein D1224_00470 [Henriciella barbarensis]